MWKISFLSWAHYFLFYSALTFHCSFSSVLLFYSFMVLRIEVVVSTFYYVCIWRLEWAISPTDSCIWALVPSLGCYIGVERGYGTLRRWDFAGSMSLGWTLRFHSFTQLLFALLLEWGWKCNQSASSSCQHTGLLLWPPCHYRLFLWNWGSRETLSS